MPLLIFLVLFIGVPVAEIAVLIKVGGLIGLWPTIAAILATAIIGTALIRHQGLQVIGRAQQAMNRHEVPVDPVIHGMFLLLAGALLLTPGFITDLIGFLCLVPPLRLLVAAWVWSRLQASGGIAATHFSATNHQQSGANGETTIIEGEFTTIESDVNGKPDPNSPWVKKE
mgnify:CR=1 FL=1